MPDGGSAARPAPLAGQTALAVQQAASPGIDPTSRSVDEERPMRGREAWAISDPTDPLVRSLHAGLPFEPAGAPPRASALENAVSATSRVSLERLLPQLVRRIAWSGDAHRGTARLEFGQGQLEGATLIVHSDRGAVSVQLEVPPGVDGAEWKARIGKRLDARGLHIAELEVR
jgi:hypothetical protein